ncbi:MAG: iron-containing alcohol dehydrogenase, partial [Proteobacteria bacterium]|nr:iron-containing alcohol dehydrogenase [Pseudomonadota bacterium]
MIASITGPRLMLVGGGASAEIAAVLQRLGCARPLVVSDKFMQSSGPLDRVSAKLKAAGIDHGLFVDTVPDPTSDVLEVGVARVRERDYDCLVALGGGSPMDTAKGI